MNFIALMGSSSDIEPVEWKGLNFNPGNIYS